MISTIITRDKKPAKVVISENEQMDNHSTLVLKAEENEPELQANAEHLTQDEIDMAISTSNETDLSSEDLTNEPSQDIDLTENTDLTEDPQVEKEPEESQEEQPQQKVEEQPQQAKAKKSKKS